MGEACRKFETPVTGGNVSFYNQNPDGPVYPTPTIGMVGLLDDIHNKMTLDFKEEGDVIYLIGLTNDDINCSEYLHKICGVQFSPAPYFNLEEEFSMQEKMKELIGRKIILSAHDISEGGLFVTLCESGFNRELGFSVKTNKVFRKDACLFGEGQGRAIVSVAEKDVEEFEKTMNDFPYEKLGIVTSGEIIVDKEFWGMIDGWKEKYDNAISNYLLKEEAGSALGPI